MIQLTFLSLPYRLLNQPNFSTKNSGGEVENFLFILSTQLTKLPMGMFSHLYIQVSTVVLNTHDYGFQFSHVSLIFMSLNYCTAVENETEQTSFCFNISQIQLGLLEEGNKRKMTWAPDPWRGLAEMNRASDSIL